MSQLTGTEQIDFMYDAGGEVIGLKFEGANYYYLKNLQGDILYVVDSSGQIVVKYDYDSWGKLRSTAGSMATTLGVKNPFRYRSYYYDTETGLYYLNSRYYDPDTGRFVNADGYISTGQGIIGHNMFAYCNNNPVNFSDPSGTMLLVDDVIIIGGALLVIGMCTVISTTSTTTGTYSPWLDLPTFDDRLDDKLTLEKTKSATKDIAIPQAEAKTKTKASPTLPSATFYPAMLLYPGIAVDGTKPMNAETVALKLLAGNNVWTANEADAIGICIYVSGGYLNGNNEGRVLCGTDALHYHLKDRYLSVHVFYGFQAVDIISRC